MSRRTKILAVIGSLDSGGCERHLLNVLPRLQRDKFEARVLTLGYPGVLAAEMETRGVKVKSCRRSKISGRYALISRLIGLSAATLQLARELRQCAPDIVHFFLPAAYVVGAPVALLCGHRRLIMSRRSLSNYQKKHPFISFFEKKLHSRMSLLLGNSRAVVEQLRGECTNCKSVKLLYNGIEPFSPALHVERPLIRASLGLEDRSLALAIVANLIPYKGHVDLLRACEEMGSKHCDWKLFVIGRDDGLGSELQALASSLGLADRVVFLGERSDARQLIIAMDIGISASHEEGFSNSILEFMAAGVPVVATDAGGNAEAVADGVTGFVVPIADPRRMGEALSLLFTDKNLRQCMGEAGRAVVQQQFTIDACVAAYEDIYARLIGAESEQRKVCAA